ncbi:COP9 signalosome complex subunit 5b-like [Hibiscus syriacus]|uniref:COP9 signalosome complex subunit 5b-like n=1 Tax=Hibiscus syriacus TaxID=106335 RepID=UPI00192233C4|nr:COP9 signalosome complex subunit 5b-like [Hibiscus syriacus]
MATISGASPRRDVLSGSMSPETPYDGPGFKSELPFSSHLLSRTNVAGCSIPSSLCFSLASEVHLLVDCRLASVDFCNVLANHFIRTRTIFYYNEAAQAKFQQEKPWANDPHYFKRVKISALAFLKMVVHARSGGTIEVMGLMQGKTDGDAIIVMDAFALPVEGTETRVNAQADAYEYMVDYSQTNKQAGRLENVVGWYHSHPGYGCWLSGIDVSTQMLNQQFQEPFLAVVIDPTRTVSAGKVEIGAFRTYREGYTPPDDPIAEYQTIPLNKIEDFGVHCKQYYPLDITYFKSSLDCHLLDLLWNKYWVNTLSSSPLLGNGDYVAGQISDLAEKLEQPENQLAHSCIGPLGPPRKKLQEESQLAKITRDSAKITLERVHGLMSQVIKNILFNSVRQSNKSHG